MEGHRFSDLTRWGQGVTELNTYAVKEAELGYTQIKGATYIAGKSEYLPIPQTQIHKSIKDGKSVLTQNPGY